MSHALALMAMDAPTRVSAELAVSESLRASAGTPPPPSLSAQPLLSPPGFSLLEQVGQGASSVVWRARHEPSGQVVALKLGRPSPAPFEVVAREALLLARVGRRWGP